MWPTLASLVRHPRVSKVADREESSIEVPGSDFHTFDHKVLFLRTKELLHKMAQDNKKDLPLPRFSLL